MIESISAITLATHDMSRAVRFYRMLEFEIIHGGEDAAFTSFRAGTSYLNLIAQPAERKWSWWGRAIFYCSDVDALHARVNLGRLPPRYGAPRCRMGRAVLPPDRSRWSRAQLRLAAAMRRRHCQRADPPWRRLGAPFQWRSIRCSPRKTNHAVAVCTEDIAWMHSMIGSAPNEQ